MRVISVKLQGVVSLVASLLAVPIRLSSQPVFRIEVVQGAGVNVILNQTAVTPVVRISDPAGLPVQGAEVVFEAPATGPGVTFGSGDSRVARVTTDAAGMAQPLSLRPNNLAGEFEIRINAMFNGHSNSVVITQRNVRGRVDPAQTPASQDIAPSPVDRVPINAGRPPADMPVKYRPEAELPSLKRIPIITLNSAANSPAATDLSSVQSAARAAEPVASPVHPATGDVVFFLYYSTNTGKAQWAKDLFRDSKIRVQYPGSYPSAVKALENEKVADGLYVCGGSDLTAALGARGIKPLADAALCSDLLRAWLANAVVINKTRE